MDTRYRQLSKIRASELCDISRSIFADYITGPYQMQIEEAEHILTSQYADLEWSQIIEVDGQPAGYVLVSTNADRARVASMGFRPEARGRGLGRLVLENLKKNLKLEGFRSLELEVFEQNKSAVSLYKSQGFAPLRRLLGFCGTSEKSGRNKALVSINMIEAAEFCATFDNCEMPWQTSAWRVRQLTSRNLAWKFDDLAVVVTSNPHSGRISLTTLMIHPDNRRRGVGQKIVRAIQAEFPDTTIMVPQLCPEEAEPFFSSLGFRQLQLNQIQMRTVL